MKTWGLVAVALSIGMAGLAACGGKGTGGSGGGTTVTHTSTTTTVVSVGSGGTGGTPNCGSLMFSSNAMCEACVESNCCSELMACDTGSMCDALLTCLQGCTPGDMTCQTNCQSMNAGGVSDAMALFNCFNTSCKSDPSCSSGQICDSGLVDQGNPMCGDCDGMNCCMQFDACVMDPTCKGCITGATMTGCDTNAALMAVQSCQMMKCGDSCGVNICDSGLSTGNGKCDMCLGSKCCAPIDACKADTTCLNTCLSNGMRPMSCNSNTLFMAVQTCWNTNCSDANTCNGML